MRNQSAVNLLDVGLVDLIHGFDPFDRYVISKSDFPLSELPIFRTSHGFKNILYRNISVINLVIISFYIKGAS